MFDGPTNLPQTDWSMIHDLRQPDRGRRDAAMERLVRRYWPAIYAYLRRSGRDVHKAADLTQGFITTVILKRRMAEHAQPERGRFRWLLLKSLKNYLSERHRHDTRQRRSLNGRAPLPFSQIDVDAAEGSVYDTPDSAFSYHWSATMVRQVLESVRAACVADGLEPHWEIFEGRVVRPLLEGDSPVPLSEFVDRLELEDEAQASNMAITVKRRFAKALIAEIKKTISDEKDVEEELSLLLSDLERPHP